MSESSKSGPVPLTWTRQELSRIPLQAVPSLIGQQSCGMCVCQAELLTVLYAAKSEKDLGTILVVEMGAAGERTRDKTESKATT